jgi:hypothetical protein
MTNLLSWPLSSDKQLRSQGSFATAMGRSVRMAGLIS